MNQNISDKAASKHRLELEGRKVLTLSGVEDVLGFEETSVILSTTMGILTVEGEELHIRHMSMEDGNLVIDGKIGGILYVDKSTRKSGLWGKKSKK
ncbi:MAG: YabP/YqfC family sporulation protein [Eubacteriales bacterium]